MTMLTDELSGPVGAADNGLVERARALAPLLAAGAEASDELNAEPGTTPELRLAALFTIHHVAPAIDFTTTVDITRESFDRPAMASEAVGRFNGGRPPLNRIKEPCSPTKGDRP